MSHSLNTQALGTRALKTPSSTSRRLTGIDLARGIAIIGMMAVHSLVAYNEDFEPTLMYSLSAGHASTLFALLAGVAIAFLSGRTVQPRTRASLGTASALATRAVLIGLIGLALGYTDIEYAAVILTYYAVMFLLAIPLIYLSSRVLAVITVIGVLAMPVLSQWLRASLPESLDGQLSWHTVLDSPGHMLVNLLFTGEFPVLIWMSFVTLGIIVGRLALHTARTAAYLVASGIALTAVSTAVSWVLLHPLGGLTKLEAATDPEYLQEVLAFGADGTTPTDSWWWLAIRAPHTGTTLDQMAIAGGALVTLGVCLLLFHLPWPALARATRILVAPIVAIGTMSLTIYVAHIMFINSDFDHYGPWDGYLRQILVMCVAALAWKATAGRGPLEGLIRSITGRIKRAVDGSR